MNGTGKGANRTHVYSPSRRDSLKGRSQIEVLSCVNFDFCVAHVQGSAGGLSWLAREAHHNAAHLVAVCRITVLDSYA
jgi:hypothetical protein